MTANEMKEAIGQFVWLRVGYGMRVECKVLDAKTSYGKPRLLVTPVAGRGNLWVALSSLETTPDLLVVHSGQLTFERR